ncbi:MAG: exodeoxyribonuclease VII large subunit [Gammaproteobacteria bacterium]|nr:exodeoxyribonuclease VII large subunit [Gammaproteobacteria bacterium]
MNLPQNAPEILSVSQLNRQVKRLLENHFEFVWVEGEISNFVRPGSGHWYFTLKDDSGQVRCAMFRNRNQRVRLRPQNGQQIRLRAKVSLYEGRGEFQLIVEHMEAAGAGALQLAFEELKQRLQDEGLFAQELKQDLPSMPRHIGIITSPSGAAVRDIITVFKRRFPGIELSVLPVAVQGDEAAPAIVAALASANRLHLQLDPPLDALVLTRGGGSIEDLWCFNDERVVRAIAASELPVVSAVGHEIDFTIADFVADARAATPSAAAELLSPDRTELMNAFRSLEKTLQRSVLRRLRDAGADLLGLRRRTRHPGDRLQEQAQGLDELEQRLLKSVQLGVTRRQQQLQLLLAHLQRLSPGNALTAHQLRLQHLRHRHTAAMGNRVAHLQQRLARFGGMLHSLSPLATLERGYAMVTDTDGKLVTDSKQVAKGDMLRTKLAKGHFVSQVRGRDW